MPRNRTFDFHTLAPLDPIFRPETKRGGLAVGNSPTEPYTTVFCDDFNRADGPVGPNWSSGTIVSNELDLGGGASPASQPTASLYIPNMWAEGTVGTWDPGSNRGGSLHLRVNGSSFYRLGLFDDPWRLTRFNIGVGTTLDTGAGAPAGGAGVPYRIRGECYTDSNSDVVLTIFEDVAGSWVQRNTYIDSAVDKLTTGYNAAVQSWTSGFTAPTWDDFCMGIMAPQS
jgi:hypothetical protein